MIRHTLQAILFSLLFLILFSINADGQTDYRFRHIGIEDGLSQGSIYHMLKDSRGFLWMGTEDGINRFDGKKIKLYMSGATGESTYIQGITEDTLSNLWIGSHKGVYQYVRKMDKFIKPVLKNSPGTESVHVFGGQAKSVFFLTEKGLFLLQKNTLILITREMVYTRSQYNNFIVQSPDGTIWLLDPELGIKSYSSSTHRVSTYFSDKENNVFGQPETFSCINFDRRGNMWLAGRGGLTKFDLKNNSVKNYKKGLDFQQYNTGGITEDKTGLIWLATEGNGILVFDPAKEAVVRRIAHQDDVTNSLKFNEIGNIYIDDNNDVFVNTDPQGLDVITQVPSAFSFYTYGKNIGRDLNGYSIRGIAEGKDSTIWIGTELSGINRFDPKTEKIRYYGRQDGLPGNTVRFILKSDDNRIWVATLYGFAVFNPVKDAFTPIALPAGCEIATILDIGKGMLLLATNKGLILFDTRIMKVDGYDYPELVSGYDAFIDDATSWIYISTRFRGTSVFVLKDGKLKLKKTILENFHVLKTYKEPGTPYLWAGTDAGLVKYNLKEGRILKNYRVKDGLHHEYIYSMVPDNAGNLWLSTNKGLTRFNPATERFDFIKEIAPREYNSRSSLAASRGELYFGSTTGLDRIKPAVLSLQNEKVGVQLTELFYDGKEDITDSLYIGELDQLRLPYESNTISLKFTATDFRSGGINRFRYFLKGYDLDTVYSGSVDQARYVRLPAGKYEFQIQASDVGGNWVSPVRKLGIEIQTPYWQTWWFVLLSGLLIFAMIWLTISSYLNSRLTIQKIESGKIIYLEKERSRIARDMNDSLGSELFGLKLLGQVALAQSNKEDSDSQLKKIVDISKSISEKISEVIWLTDVNQDNAESLWSYIQKNALIYLKPSGIPYFFFNLPENHKFLISGERRHEILNFHKHLFTELAKINCHENMEISFKIFATNLFISIKEANLEFIDSSIFDGLRKLGGNVIPDQEGFHILRIPLDD